MPVYRPPLFYLVNFKIDDHGYSAPDHDAVDFQFFKDGNGTGFISGTVSIQGTPEEDCTVRLFDSSGNFIQETTTDALGNYIFENLDRDVRFDVIAQDQAKFWEKQIRSLVAPEAMP